MHSSLRIVNVYRPAAATLELGELFAGGGDEYLLIGGDFNAHHPVLASSAPSNAAGTAIAAALEDSPAIFLVNSPASTHVRGGTLDLTFASEALRPIIQWSILNDVLSDHFGVLSKLNLPLLPPPPPPLTKWNLDRADWALFLRHMDNWAASYDEEQLDDMARDFANAVVQSANSSIPTTTGRRSTRKHHWCYSPEVARLRHQLNQAKKAFRRSRTEDRLAVLREVASGICERLAELCTEKWLSWCQEVSAHTPSSEIWKWLRRVAGKRRERPPPVICPAKEANRLVDLFATQAGPDTLPQEVKTSIQDALPGRTRLIEEAYSTPSVLDTPLAIFVCVA